VKEFGFTAWLEVHLLDASDQACHISAIHRFVLERRPKAPIEAPSHKRRSRHILEVADDDAILKLSDSRWKWM